jgi:acyl carrier protein
MNTILRQPTQSAADRIRYILLDFDLPVASLTDQAHFILDLGMDSLDRTDLLLRVEDEFGIHITDQDWHKLRTIDALMEYLLVEEGIGAAPRRSPLVMTDYAVCCN